MADKKEVTIPSARTRLFSADELAELKVALEATQADSGDYFISPETGMPVHKNLALAHAEAIFGSSTGHPRAQETAEHKLRREYIEAQYVKPAEEES